MTAAQLLDLLVARLAREQGGTKQHWRALLGTVQTYSLRTHAHCNWAITPTGTRPEIATIERLIDELRASHPIVESNG